MVRLLTNRAKTDPKRVVFAEADHLDVLKAAQIVWEEGIGHPILLGNREVILNSRKSWVLMPMPIYDPKTKEEDGRRLHYAEIFWKARQRRGISLLDAQKWMRERNYFAAMMVNEGEADALVTGFSRSYPSVVKPMMQLIGKRRHIADCHYQHDDDQSWPDVFVGYGD
jgi:malate dehydrogenase (oxaloacetate-decarboxylating)(NADP+)